MHSILKPFDDNGQSHQVPVHLDSLPSNYCWFESTTIIGFGWLFRVSGVSVVIMSIIVILSPFLSSSSSSATVSVMPGFYLITVSPDTRAYDFPRGTIHFQYWKFDLIPRVIDATIQSLKHSSNYRNLDRISNSADDNTQSPNTILFLIYFIINFMIRNNISWKSTADNQNYGIIKKY